jgi:hypothetical protein
LIKPKARHWFAQEPYCRFTFYTKKSLKTFIYQYHINFQNLRVAYQFSGDHTVTQPPCLWNYLLRPENFRAIQMNRFLTYLGLLGFVPFEFLPSTFYTSLPAFLPTWKHSWNVVSQSTGKRFLYQMSWKFSSRFKKVTCAEGYTDEMTYVAFWSEDNANCVIYDIREGSLGSNLYILFTCYFKRVSKLLPLRPLSPHVDTNNTEWQWYKVETLFNIFMRPTLVTFAEL